MARGVNKVILIGNLGQDPDLRHAPNGNAVVNLSLATDESYKDRQSGQMVPKTEWHRVVMFGKLAEIASQYLRKGSKVYIEGKLQTRKWQNKEGQDVYTTEVVVDINGQMQMLDSGNGAQGANAPQGGGQNQNQQQQGNNQPQQQGNNQPQQQGNNGGYQQQGNNQPQQQGNNGGYQQQGNNQPQQQNNNGGYQQQGNNQPQNNGNYQQGNNNGGYESMPEPVDDFDDDIPF